MKKILAIVVFLILSFSFFPFLKADQSVSLTIPPRSSDFQLSLWPMVAGTLPQNGILTYTITYGSHLHYADKLIIEATWDEGTIDGDSIPTIDGISYVNDSASPAYNNTTPIVYPTQNTIRWTIPNFPAQTTNQTVSFGLQATGAYTDLHVGVSFPVHVRLIAPAFTTADQSMSIHYQYLQNISSPAVSGPTSAHSVPLPSLVPISGKISSPAQFPSPVFSTINLTILDLSQNSTQFAVTIPNKAKATVVYGLSPTLLTHSSPIAVSGTSGLLTLSNLEPSTMYFMQIVTTAPGGGITKSDVFALQTPSVSQQPEISKTSIVITGSSDVLYSATLATQNSTNPQTELNKIPQVPIASNANYNLTFKLSKPDKIKYVAMVLSSLSVLGASTLPLPQSPHYTFPVIEKSQGIYSAEVKNPPGPGKYEVSIRISDFDGNITTQKVAEFHVLHPIRVLNSITKQPIEDVRIVFSSLDPETQKYMILPAVGSFKNPIYTNKNGEASQELPSGTYKIALGYLGYEGKTVSFTLGSSQEEDFPTVFLKRTPITPFAILRYYGNSFVDWLVATTSYIQAIQASYRFFDLIGLSVVFCFIVLTLLLFQMKTHIGFSHIPSFFHHHMASLLHIQDNPYIYGKVVDAQTNNPLADATIFAIDEKSKQIIHKTKTNKAGGFLIPSSMAKGCTISTMKEGYQEAARNPYSPDMVISLHKGTNPGVRNYLRFLWEATEDFLSLFFEFVLFFTFIMAVVLFPAFEPIRVVPFLVASIVNFFLWIFYLREKGKQFSVN